MLAATNADMNIASGSSSPPSAVRAAVIAGVVTFLPAVGFVLTHSAVHRLRMLALGALCGVVSAVCFGLYSRVASAVVLNRTLVRRMRVAANAEPAEILADPLAEEELELEARFAEMERRER